MSIKNKYYYLVEDFRNDSNKLELEQWLERAGARGYNVVASFVISNTGFVRLILSKPSAWH